MEEIFTEKYFNTNIFLNQSKVPKKVQFFGGNNIWKKKIFASSNFKKCVLFMCQNFCIKMIHINERQNVFECEQIKIKKIFNNDKTNKKAKKFTSSNIFPKCFNY